MTVNYSVKQNDRLPAFVIIARDSVGPVDLAGATATLRMVNVLTGAVKIEAPASIAIDPTFTAAGATLTANAHPLVLDQDVTLKTDGVLPGGLSSSQKYFVVKVTTNTFRLALTKGGTAITTTDAGTGTHTVLQGKLSYQWQAADTDTAGTYQGHVETLTAGRRLTFPNDGHILLEVVSDLSDNSDRTVAVKAVMDRVQPDAVPQLRQGEIELEVDRARLASVWLPGTEYVYGEIVVPPRRNGSCYMCVEPGTSAASHLFTEWPCEFGEVWSEGQVQNDSVLTWENIGTDRFNTGIAGAERNLYDIGRAAKSCWLIKMRRASQFISDGDLSFNQVHTNCVAQANSFQPFRRQTRIVRTY